jgi:hypothetical protein
MQIRQRLLLRYAQTPSPPINMRQVMQTQHETPEMIENAPMRVMSEKGR